MAVRTRFGAFMLDTDTRQLLREGEEIHLSPKAFELLSLLVEHRPQALTKTELQEHLWPDTFVSEANLPGLIKEIRRALGDDPRGQRFVRTLHGFGYAFNNTASREDEVIPGRRPGTATFWVISDAPIALREGENILGRDPEVTVWFDRPGVSRRHARIVVSGDEATLEDLGSRNGTFVRGERVVAPSVLQDGDEIRLGSLSVTFRVRRAAGPTETEIVD
jgi:DNA-binding winged helix-turn-helix (wHTH) protein